MGDKPWPASSSGSIFSRSARQRSNSANQSPLMQFGKRAAITTRWNTRCQRSRERSQQPWQRQPFRGWKAAKAVSDQMPCSMVGGSRAAALIWIMGWSARQRPSRTSGEVPPATPWTAVTAERLALTLENASSTAITSFSAVRLSKSGRPQSERLRPKGWAGAPIGGSTQPSGG